MNHHMILTPSLRFAGKYNKGFKSIYISSINKNRQLLRLTVLFLVAEVLNVKINLYLADDVSRQVKKAEGVSFVPRVQHTQEMGDVICTFPSTC